jgi:hypothetical protein
MPDRVPVEVPCPKCGAVRELYLNGSWERELAFSRQCWGCRTGRAGDHFRKRGVAETRGDRPLPAGPTTAEPGTAEKLAVMELRLAAGQRPHHPADPKIDHGPARLGLLVRLLGLAG